MFRSGGILASGKRVVARVVAFATRREVRRLERTLDDLEARVLDLSAERFFRDQGIN